MHREAVLLPHSYPNHGLSVMIGRRLDDPSFWAMFATAIAVSLIARAFYLAESNAKVVNSNTKHYFIWGITAALCILIYIVAVALRHETFFFSSHFKPATRILHTNATIITIQFIEGLANIMIIIVGTAFLAIGLLLLKAVTPSRNAKPCSLPLYEKRVAALLATAGLAPISCSLIVGGIEQGVWRGIFKLAPLKSWFFPWSWKDGVVSMLFLLWPFLLIMWLTLWRCKKSCCLRLRFGNFFSLFGARTDEWQAIANAVGIVGGILYFIPAKCDFVKGEPVTETNTPP